MAEINQEMENELFGEEETIHPEKTKALFEKNNIGRVGEKPMTTERANQFAQCLKDARQAYTIANENASSEDIRSVAISFLISEGKDKRVTQINKDKSTPKTVAKEIEYLKLDYDTNYTLTILDNLGENSSGKYPSTDYKVSYSGVEYKVSTNSKLLKDSFVVGKTVTFKKFKDGAYTKYEVSSVS